ncbi:hypothetical protein ACWIUD_04015 [Helicobacter sp. 23-1044]
MAKTFLEMVETDLSAREVRILRECSTKKPSELSDSEMQEFSEVAEKAKGALLANLATLHISKLVAMLRSNGVSINELLFGKGIVGGAITATIGFWGALHNAQNKQGNADENASLGYFGRIIKGEFTGKEFDDFFALAKARKKYIKGETDDFSEADEQRLGELAQKARGIIIAQIEPLEATKFFAYPQMTLEGKEPTIV